MMWPGLVLRQFFKDLDKLPGWAPLYLFAYAAAESSGFPTELPVGGRSFDLSIELVAGIITFVLYQLGDALDDVIFKRRNGDRRRTRAIYLAAYAKALKGARKAVEVDAGIYALSMKLVVAAEKDRSTWSIHALNELAKFTRSLAVGLLFVAGFCVYGRHLAAASVYATLGGFLLAGYPWLKVGHLRRLYRTVEELVRVSTKEDYRTVWAQGMRFVFWKNELVHAVGG